MSKQKTLKQIIDMTKLMLAHAQSGDWNTVISMEADRQLKMDEYFTMSPSAEDAEWITDGILSVINMDKEIMDLGRSDLDKLGDTLSQIQRGKRAQFAYQKLA